MFFRSLFKPVGAVRDILAGTFGAFGVHPNALTLAAIPLALLTAWFYAHGEIFTAGLLLIPVGLCDMVDGPLARRFKRGSTFGSVLDFVTDLYVDMILLAGVLIYFLRINSFAMLLFTLSAIIGTVLLSSSRARAEQFIESAKVGFLERTERFVILLIGSLVGHLVLVIGFLGIFTHVDVIRRLVHTHLVLKNTSETEEKDQE